MRRRTDVDALIIGAGIVGLATASAISEQLRRVVVVERRPSFGLEISSRSSEVIHAGLYYSPGSLKARLCVEGAALVVERCRRLGIPFVLRGKLIVSCSSEQEEALLELYANATSCGALGLELWGAERLRQEEPSIVGTAALHSPLTGVVDSHELVRSFAVESASAGVDHAYRHSLVGLERCGETWVAEIVDPEGEFLRIATPIVINAAGLGADALASTAGIDVEEAGYRITPCKGDYFALSSGALRGIERLLYPLPDVNLQGLGVHLTIDVAGQARLGPDASYISPLPLTSDDHQLNHDVDTGKLQGFLGAGRCFLPWLEPEDLTADRSGTRPKLAGLNEATRDFVICHEIERGLGGLVNLIGIESPGLTAAPAIARMVVHILMGDGFI